MKIFQNTFVMGLIMAVAVAVTDVLNAVLGGGEFSWKVMLVAAGIALFGYIGRFLSGSTNTTLAGLGAALIAIIPLVTGGPEDINWQTVILTFVVKFIGLITHGASIASSSRPRE